MIGLICAAVLGSPTAHVATPLEPPPVSRAATIALGHPDELCSFVLVRTMTAPGANFAPPFSPSETVATAAAVAGTQRSAPELPLEEPQPTRNMEPTNAVIIIRRMRKAYMKVAGFWP